MEEIEKINDLIRSMHKKGATKEDFDKINIPSEFSFTTEEGEEIKVKKYVLFEIDLDKFFIVDIEHDLPAYRFEFYKNSNFKKTENGFPVKLSLFTNKISRKGEFSKRKIIPKELVDIIETVNKNGIKEILFNVEKSDENS